MELTRLIVTQPDGTIVGDIDPTLIVDAGFVQEVNGEHSVTLSTFEELSKNDRILWRDEMGVWHENVVEGLDGEHGEHGETLHEYWCPWSLQHDLAATFVTAMPGTGGTPAPALAALQAALGGTERWEVGTVTQTSSGSASMWRVSGWEAMQTLVEVWGGELSATIDVSLDGVVGRYVNLLAHVGATTPSRRFDYGGDLLGIRRIVADQPWTCRVLPLGKAQQTEGGGYGRKITIESVNGGVPWLEDSSATPLVRVPTEDGWEYPTQIVENHELDDPAALKAWALEHLTDWTLPKVSYEVDVLQLAAAGTDATGVAEGDEVVVVDHGFTGDGLAIQGRALRIEGSLLDPAQTKLTISNLTDTLGGQLDSIARSVSTLADQQQATSLYQATADYLSELLGRLNGEANATGGYTYITEGEGIRTYDRAVSDPLVGAEATKVVEVKGGTIRIADSRTAQGAWDWRTVFVSGHILADLVTAAKLTAGHIGSADSGNYWNLDSGEFRMASTAQLGSKTVQQVVDAVDDTITGVDVEFAQGTSPTQAPASGWQTQPPAWEEGKYIWQRTATTTAAGTTYSEPVMISGKDGADGTSVTIRGSYNTYAELIAAHPTGQDGDAYMVGTDLYVWNGSAWEDVGQIQGPQGPAGTSVTVSSIQYGTSASASTTPSNWVTTPPTSITQGTWLWVKTNYSNGSTATTKSYVGTNGTSVYITSTTKVGDTTTVTFNDGSTITIKDGEDGATGQRGPAGADGESTYIHTAWANSQDGSTDFSTTVSAGKSYLGVCTTDTEPDPTTPSSYSWSKIEGDAGADGKGVSSVVEQYYLSTSSSTQSGGSWVTTPPAYVVGKYYWTRTVTTYSDSTVLISDPVLSRGLNSANKTAADAQAQLDVLDTQEGVFNRLTNNGALQGLYMSNGQLYVNATYIKSGFIGNADSTSYWDLADGTIVIVNATKNQWGYNDVLEFGQTGITDTSGWLNTITSAQTVTGLRVGNNGNYAYSGRGAIQLIPNLPATDAANPGSISAIASRFALKLLSNSGLVTGDTSSRYKSGISLNSQYIEMNTMYGSTVYPGIVIGRNGYVYLYAKRSDYTLNNGSAVSSIDSTMSVNSSGVTINGNAYIHLNSTHMIQATASSGVTLGESSSSRYVNLLVYGKGTFQDGIVVPKNKSRLVETEHYNDRLLYCDEMPSPFFTDIGSGTIGEDGLCYVEIDAVFAETVRTDMTYQVFLQKCGEGDLWVAEKTPTHFVVKGTAGLPFDWQLKAHQMGFEFDHLETYSMQTINDETATDAYQEWANTVYDTDLNYAAQIEALYETEESDEAA